MDRRHLIELHYITPIANLTSILKRGILSHRKAKRLQHESVAMPEVQDIRATKSVPGGRPLHDYANLYVNARNPMLYKRGSEFGRLAVLQVATGVLDLPDVVISDQNAASGYVRFAAAPGGVHVVNEEYTFADSWKHPDDQIEEWRHKSRMCAEVLVPDSVPPKFITGIYVSSERSAAEVRRTAPELAPRVNHRLFFQ